MNKFNLSQTVLAGITGFMLLSAAPALSRAHEEGMGGKCTADCANKCSKKDGGAENCDCTACTKHKKCKDKAGKGKKEDGECKHCRRHGKKSDAAPEDKAAAPANAPAAAPADAKPAEGK